MVTKSEIIFEWKKTMSKNIMTPHIISYKVRGNKIIEVAEGTGLENQKIFGVTVRRYNPRGVTRWIDLGEGKLFDSKKQAIAYSNKIKDVV